MWITFLIWLVEFILKTFLKSNTELRDKVAESIKRMVEYEELLSTVNEEIRLIDKDIQENLKIRDNIIRELTDIEFEISEAEQKREKVLNEYKEGIDAMSDAIVVRADL